MIDLHTHSLFSDGCLLPSELVYRAKAAGYTAICVADHVDFSTLDFAVPRIARIAAELTKHYGIIVAPGAEITYVPPKLIGNAVDMARRFGAKIVIVHGETPSETVPPGTNLAGILAGADILAHPGHITPADVKIAAEKGVLLEISARKFHKSTNSHVASLAKKFGAKLILDSDTHDPGDYLSVKLAKKTLSEAHLPWKEFAVMQRNAAELLEK
jgi:histidinol phosphatase-like PHP family hydrolase